MNSSRPEPEKKNEGRFAAVKCVQLLFSYPIKINGNQQLAGCSSLCFLYASLKPLFTTLAPAINFLLTFSLFVATHLVFLLNIDFALNCTLKCNKEGGITLKGVEL